MPDLSFMLRLTAALLGSGLIAFLATPLVKSLAYKVGAIEAWRSLSPSSFPPLSSAISTAPPRAFSSAPL